MLRIGIDLINLRTLPEGVGRYAKQLIYALAAVDQENKYVLFINAEIAQQIDVDNPRFHKQVVKTPHRRYAPWNQIYFALHGKQLQGIDLLHSPVSVSPLLISRKTKMMVTMLDLSFKVFPTRMSAKAKLGILWWNLAWPRSLKCSSHIVAISENTKRDIMKFCGISEEKITVIYPYCSLRLPQGSSVALNTLRARYYLPERYILHVGVPTPHKKKNLESLIRAFHIVKKQNGITHKLVLVCPKGWVIESLMKEIFGLNLQDEVIFTGLVPDDDLALLYHAADVFVFPSLYEGFGYPPLEAMACGVPVVVSNSSSLPEVVGDAGLYIDPLNPKDIAEKILQVISSPELAEKLMLLGLKRAQQFSMERMAQKYLEVYRKVCGAEPSHCGDSGMACL